VFLALSWLPRLLHIFVLASSMLRRYLEFNGFTIDFVVVVVVV